MDESLRSERLRLRFVRFGEASLLAARFAPEPGGFNDFGGSAAPRPSAGGAPPSPDAEIRNEHTGQLWVELRESGEPIGTVQYHQVRYGGNAESSGWMIGIDLLPEARGRGYGAEAQRLVADFLFETTPANRIEAETDVENLAEMRSLEKAGFRREGILRGAQFRAGAYHDLVVYSRLRSDAGTERSKQP
jgi:RimJ/RimL family protein N-acetyltransferase